MERKNLPDGELSKTDVGNFKSASFPVSSRYISRPPSTEFLDNLSVCQAKIANWWGRLASILSSKLLKTSRPGTLAVFFSIKVSTISRCSRSANSFSSVNWASSERTWRSSSSVLLRMYIKYFRGLLARKLLISKNCFQKIGNEIYFVICFSKWRTASFLKIPLIWKPEFEFAETNHSPLCRSQNGPPISFWNWPKSYFALFN